MGQIGPSGKSLKGVYKSVRDDKHVVVYRINFTKPRICVCYAVGRVGTLLTMNSICHICSVYIND